MSCYNLATISCFCHGTVFDMTLYLHHLLYFGSHILTLLCSLFVVVLAMVVLAVIYLDHIKNCYVM